MIRKSYLARAARVKEFITRRTQRRLRTVLRAFASYRYVSDALLLTVSRTARKQRRERRKKLQQRLNTRIRRRVLSAFRAYARREKKLRHAVAVVESKWIGASLLDAFAHWRSLAHAENVVRLSEQRRAASLAVKAFTAWRRHTVSERKCRRHVMSRHLRAWKSFVASKVNAVSIAIFH